MRIILSRSDAIGDVILTLPMAGILKKMIPGCEIIFLGRSYTRSVISISEHVDQFVDFDEMKSAGTAVSLLKSLKADCIIHVFPKKEIAYAAKNAGIKLRIGTSHRLYHLFSCNRLIKIGRKNSDLHESQLNIRLLEGLDLKPSIALDKIHEYFGFTKMPLLPERLSLLTVKGKFNLILHPASNASAREWPLTSFSELIHLLDPDKFKIFITGQKQENETYNNWLKSLPENITDCTGQMNLDELISFINSCDGLVACSTGPLHIAAALNKRIIGLYPPIRPMDAGRWGAIGLHVENMSLNKVCNTCRDKPKECPCMHEISAVMVAAKVNAFFGKIHLNPR